ncbi:MAG TPA: glycosyltransferase family 4 protein [Rhodanobacteraceae bacterium]|nr:glycosyltransferase family 4 protein [Rhodanobacteraceae bacterium]
MSTMPQSRVEEGGMEWPRARGRIPRGLPGRETLRIAQVAPLTESVPPSQYGGTERVVAYLSEALAAAGHEVTLFASGDSSARVELHACCPQALRGQHGVCDPQLWWALQFQAVLDRADSFDVIHFHTGYLHFPLHRYLPPHLTTLHGRLDFDPPQFYARYPDSPLVSISEAQRKPWPQAAWLRTIHHGLPLDLLHAGPGDGGYLAFIGRLSPEKRVDRAIEIARRAGLPLKIAAKIDEADAAYVAQSVRPLLEQAGVQFLGEADEWQKQALLAHAVALLFPIDWPEPFGLVMIEALACGTPVIAYAQGSVTEIIEHGRSGFLVDSIPAAVSAVRRVHEISRNECRRVFEQRFTAERMAADYVEAYRAILPAGHPQRAPGLGNGLQAGAS